MLKVALAPAHVNTCSHFSAFRPAIANPLRFTESICGRTHVVVDQSNMFRGGRDRGFRLDFEQVLKFLGGDTLVSATIVVSQSVSHRPSQLNFYARLQRLGWDVHTFLLLQNEFGEMAENEFLVDGDVRAEIRAAARSPAVDAVVVMSGDGGMTNAVKDARRAGKDVFVLAWDGTLNPALAAAATACITLEEMRPLIGRPLIH